MTFLRFFKMLLPLTLMLSLVSTQSLFALVDPTRPVGDEWMESDANYGLQLTAIFVPKHLTSLPTAVINGQFLHEGDSTANGYQILNIQASGVNLKAPDGTSTVLHLSNTLVKRPTQ